MKRRVLFDASPMLDVKKTGVGYYVEYLMRSLAKSGELELHGYFFDFLSRHHKQPPSLPNTTFHPIRFIPGKVLSLSRRLGFQPPLRFFTHNRADVVLFTNYVSLPVSSRQVVAVVIYDLGFIDHPEFTQEKNLAFLRAFCPPSIERADIIITISEFTKGRIESLFPSTKGRVVVTPIPPVSISQNPTTPDTLSPFGLSDRQFILYMGTIEPRKNLVTLLEGYKLLPRNLQKQYPLVLAGGKGWKDEVIRSAIAEQQKAGTPVVVTGYVSDQQKQALYQQARCCVIPSHYEGFGMPLLEAMQYQLPVAASDIDVFHEVAGDGAIYFDKDSPDSICSALKTLLLDDVVRRCVVENQPSELAKFSWEENAQRVTEAFLALSNPEYRR